VALLVYLAAAKEKWTMEFRRWIGGRIRSVGLIKGVVSGHMMLSWPNQHCRSDR